MFPTVLTLGLILVILVSAVDSKEIPYIEWEDGVFGVFHISNGVFVYGNSIYNGMFVVSNKGVIVVDGPPVLAEYLPTMVASVTDLPIHTVIYSHHHRDHIGAIGLYESILDIEYVAHENTIQALQDSPFYNENNTPKITKIIRTYKKIKSESSDDSISKSESMEDDPMLDSKSVKYKLGNQTLILSHPFTVHTTNDLWIQVVTCDINILHIIDSLIGPFNPPIGGFGSNIAQYIKAFRYLIDLDTWDVMITGHTYRLTTRDDVSKLNEFLDDLIASVFEALQVLPPPIVTKYDNIDPLAQFIESTVDYCRNTMKNTYGWGIVEGKVVPGTNSFAMVVDCLSIYFYLVLD